MRGKKIATIRLDGMPSKEHWIGSVVTRTAHAEFLVRRVSDLEIYSSESFNVEHRLRHHSHMPPLKNASCTQRDLSLLVPFVATLALVAACDSDPPAMSGECLTNAECRAGFICVNQKCEEQQRPSQDAGAPSGCRRDVDCRAPRVCVAGTCIETARMDAGNRDAGRPDTGTRDAGTPDTGPPDAQPIDGGVCGPEICEERDAECDEVIDDCGVRQDCGTCRGSGLSCEQNQCVCEANLCASLGSRYSCNNNECSCSKLSCSSAGVQCGMINDGCGGTRTCSCSNGRQCQGSQCVCPQPSCTNRCGTVQNQCGATQNCGGCGNDQRCRSNGTCCNLTIKRTNWHTFRTARDIPDPGIGNHNWRNVGGATQFGGEAAEAYFSYPRMCPGTRSYRSTLLRLSGAGLNVPSTAKVIGVVAEVTMRHLGIRPELRTVHLWGPTSSGPATSNSVWGGGAPGMLTNDFRALTFGGPSNDWGLGAAVLRPNFVNNPNFSVNVAFDRTLECTFNSDSSAQVDHARVQVYYEDCE